MPYNDRYSGPRTEIVIVAQTQTGTVKHATLSPKSAINMIEAFTEAGAVIQQVYRREPQIYTREAFPELYATENATEGAGDVVACEVIT